MSAAQPSIPSEIESSPLYNRDLAPAGRERQTWGTYNFAALWVSMSVNILTYMLAAGLVQGGMNWKQALATVVPAWGHLPYGPAICFVAFWLINLFVILKGIEYIRVLQGISAPVLLAVGVLLLGWAYVTAGGFGPMLKAPSRFSNFPEFLQFLVPALNGTVGFWATVSLNIPDFTRFARRQREQVIGQALALPTTMTLYSLIGILVTSATVVIYGTA